MFLQIGVIMSDYPQKALYVSSVCHISVITYVHKYKDYICAGVGLCNCKVYGHAAILFNSELVHHCFDDQGKTVQGIECQYLLDVFSYIFILACCFI